MSPAHRFRSRELGVSVGRVSQLTNRPAGGGTANPALLNGCTRQSYVTPPLSGARTNEVGLLTCRNGVVLSNKSCRSTTFLMPAWIRELVAPIDLLVAQWACQCPVDFWVCFQQDWFNGILLLLFTSYPTDRHQCRMI